MSLIIDLTASEEEQISAEAKRNGIAPAEFVKQLVREHLPVASTSGEIDLDAKLRKWQQMDTVRLYPNVSAKDLFAKWAEEDAHMTDEECEAEDRLWEELEPALSKRGRTLELRRSS